MQGRSGRTVCCAVAVLITAVAVKACGSLGMSHRAGMPGIDAVWSALRVCVLDAASLSGNGEVRPRGNENAPRLRWR